MINSAYELRTIGNLLKERRHERELSIEEVSKITKIRSKYIQALEEGTYDMFPSEVYLKGFLKNYSRFLGINPERAHAMFRREREYQQKEPTIGVSSKIRNRKFNFEITPGRLVILAALIAIVFTVIYIGSYIGNILEEPRLELTEPVAVSAGNEGVHSTQNENIRISGNVEIGATLIINGQEFETNNFEQFVAEFNLEDGLNTFDIRATSQFGKEASLTLNVIKETEVVPTPTPTVAPTAAEIQSMQILIEILDREAYIEADIDGENRAGRVFEPGAIIELEATSSFQFSTPRPDAVSVSINGEVQTIDSSQVFSWTIENGEITQQ